MSGDGQEATQAQILIALGELKSQVAVVDTKLGAIPTEDHENRIRALERFRWTIGGLALAGGAASSLVGYLLGHAGVH
jgi:hypothetical protein